MGCAAAGVAVEDGRLTVSLIVPLGDGHNDTRERNWEWLSARWEALRPDWEIVEGRAPADRWCKADAVAAAARKATGDVWVVCDADLWVESWPTLKEAAEVARTHTWCVPCGNVYRLNHEATNAVVATDPDSPVDWPTARSSLDLRLRNNNPYRLFPGGGIFACTPDVYELAGGFDPRFVGWGGEDTSLAAALITLVSPPVRLEASVWHLWHPRSKQAAKIGRPSGGNERLNRRYLHAEGDPEAMRQLISEREASWQTDADH